MKKQPFSFWQPTKSKPGKVSPSVSIFTPTKSKSKSVKTVPFNFGLGPGSRNIKTPYGLKVVSFFPQKNKNVKKKSMTWEQASFKFPGLSPYKDSDKDGVVNFMDCRPFDRKKHIVLKYGRSLPTGVKQTVTKFFKENPDLREEGEQLGEKKIFWRFEEPRVTHSKRGAEVARRIYKADFRAEKKTPPAVAISAYPKERIPESIKEAIKFKREVEKKRTGVQEPRMREEERVEEMIQRTNAPPRLLQGKYAKDVIKNLKAEEDFSEVIEDVEDQAPSVDVVEEMIEYDSDNPPFDDKSDNPIEK